jgi:hypothetical protein
MRLLWLLLLSFCGSNLLTAQINESDTVRFQFYSSIAGVYQKGNVNYLSLRARLEASSRITDKLVVKTQNSSLYQEFSGFRADNNVNNRNFVYFNPEARLYPFAMSFIATDFRRKINRRFFGGAGLTGQLINREKHVLKISLSTVYETTRFQSDNFNLDIYDGREKINLWRTGAYLFGLHRLSEHSVQIHYEAYWQPGIENTDNYRVFADVGIDIKAWKNLSLGIVYYYSYERVVVDTVLKQDELWLIALSYRI